jgi:hypothetical protein
VIKAAEQVKRSKLSSGNSFCSYSEMDEDDPWTGADIDQKSECSNLSRFMQETFDDKY